MISKSKVNKEIRGVILFVCILLVGSCTRNVKEQQGMEYDDSFTEIHFIDSPKVHTGMSFFKHNISVKRTENVSVTYEDMYKILLQSKVYPHETNKISFNICNLNGPTVEVGKQSVEQWNGLHWELFPYQDNVIFADMTMALPKGDTIKNHISVQLFKNPLVPSIYKINIPVLFRVNIPFTLTEDSILTNSRRNYPWGVQVLNSANDSIRLLVENFTDLDIQPCSFPYIREENKMYSMHPLTTFFKREQSDWLQKHALLKGGETLLINIPAFWNVSDLEELQNKQKYSFGKLPQGRYILEFSLEIYLTAQFKVKSEKAN